MKRLKFDSQGKLIGVDGVWNGGLEKNDNDDFDYERNKLLKSKDLSFLKSDESSFERKEGWSLYSEGKVLEPLMFTNGKTQEDVVKEVVSLIKNGKKIVFIHGMCGTGKSAIALNIARELGRAAIVVPVKSLQRQYENDYTSEKYVIKKDGKKMKIAVITGRENHDSLIEPGKSCADPFLPDTIKITDKNYSQIMEYYNKNPIIQNKLENPNIRKFRRISIAPSNPYWSPILPANLDIRLDDAKKIRYVGLLNKEFIFYHRKQGCSYYDQYLAYAESDVVVFNSAKYKIEVALNRKPETEVDIIDEADEFLDSFSNQNSLNLSRLYNSLKTINLENDKSQTKLDKLMEFIILEQKNKEAVGIDKNKIFEIKDTHIGKIIGLILENEDLQVELSFDETSYASKAVDIAENFRDFLGETFVTYEKNDNELVANLVTIDLSKKIKELMDKSKAMVFMSGTLHSEKVLKNIFGIKDFEIVAAEENLQGIVEIHRTGKEFDCKYSNFIADKNLRGDYLKSLSLCLERAKKPVLIHVNAFEDLPSFDESSTYGLKNIMRKEELIDLQKNDKHGNQIKEFRMKKKDVLFSTKCSRGVDFPGDICNSIVFTKYPNPNVNSPFWKILNRVHPNDYWEFYRDKARREFLQRIYRAVRSNKDHVYILSPDIRVIDAVAEMQRN